MSQNEIDMLAKDYSGKIRDTGMLLKRQVIAEAFKAGYAAATPEKSVRSIKELPEVGELDRYINALRHNSPGSKSVKVLQELFWQTVDAIQKNQPSQKSEQLTPVNGQEEFGKTPPDNCTSEYIEKTKVKMLWELFVQYVLCGSQVEQKMTLTEIKEFLQNEGIIN